MARKIGSAGRLGARYGKTIRDKISSIEKKQKAKQMCPYCRNQRAKRVSMGIFFCSKCNSKFTGGAYIIGR